MRFAIAALGLALLPRAARAESRWFDVKMGCGPVGAYAKSGRMIDLPGCTGRLPKDAPQVEAVMRELKQKLVDAEEALGKGKLDKVDALLPEIEAGLARTLPAPAEMPDRWEQAQHIYHDAVSALRDRRKLAPHLEELRTTWAKAVELDKTHNQKEQEGGPAEALKAAQACIAAFSSVSGLDQGLLVELEKKTPPRKLGEAAAECDRVRKGAETNLREQEKALKARRAQWRAVLKGARRQIFDAHAALPEFDGAPATWRDIAKVASWRYTTPSGVEVYTWKGNKLLRKTTEPRK